MDWTEWMVQMALGALTVILGQWVQKVYKENKEFRVNCGHDDN